MYSNGTGIVYGFHGCDKQLAEDILNHRERLKPSKNAYDWLGHGMYFWENSPARALEFASDLKKNYPSRAVGVVGGIIHLGNCLDLMDYRNLQLVKEGHLTLVNSLESAGKIIPQNRPAGERNELLLRYLDCDVIETIHRSRALAGLKPFDSVRAAFWEGKELYPGAGFREKDHIQICVINPNCIRGFFKPREYDSDYPVV